MPRPARLNAILDDDAVTRAGRDLIEVGRAFLDGGATFIQLRAKTRPGRWLLDTAERLVSMAEPFHAEIIVNDRADVARLAGAAGVHVGQDDLAPEHVRALIGDGRIIGFSTHAIAQIDDAVRRPIDYVAVGPIFGTGSKDTGYDAVGLTLVQEAARRAAPRGLGVVAIGGITIERAADVIAAGATSVAIISDLLSTGDPRARVAQYLDRLA
ncbi:MAG TPA: thiamine phosphate synthase [Vicinamibacterales bacterium]|nr:thiamine phosphate synthase [Vicinamibacterales bacterium]